TFASRVGPLPSLCTRLTGFSTRCDAPALRAIQTRAGCESAGMRRSNWTATQMREGVARNGPEAVAFAVTTPAGTAVSDGSPWIERLIRLFGSPNTIWAEELCA